VVLIGQDQENAKQDGCQQPGRQRWFAKLPSNAETNGDPSTDQTRSSSQLTIDRDNCQLSREDMPKQILIVDDSEMTRRLISTAVRTLGDIEYEEAKDGFEAIQKLATKAFDLLFVDITCPISMDLN
jgi:PleD family two-component response regulator